MKNLNGIVLAAGILAGGIGLHKMLSDYMTWDITHTIRPAERASIDSTKVVPESNNAMDVYFSNHTTPIRFVQSDIVESLRENRYGLFVEITYRELFPWYGLKEYDEGIALSSSSEPVDRIGGNL